MEAVHKELFGNDVLQVAVRMENGQFIGPIGEEYLYFYYKSSKESKSEIVKMFHSGMYTDIDFAFREDIDMATSWQTLIKYN